MISQAHVLVVDDNPTNLKLASDVLESEGFRISRALDAESALGLLETEIPDLILMDVALPGMDGLTLTRRLKSNDQTKDIIIVAVTAFAMRGDEQKVLAAGCDGYISKPINTRTLPKSVAALLERRTKRTVG